MSGSAPFWGSQAIAAVSAGGVATQLFPKKVALGTYGDTSSVYPPAAGGEIRRPTEGRIERLGINCDAVGGGYVEVWDVAGLDRGAANNVNNQLTLTDAYLQANGTLLETISVKQSGDQNAPIVGGNDTLAFERGLAIRYIGSGNVNIAPWIFAGFTVYYAPLKT